MMPVEVGAVHLSRHAPWPGIAEHAVELRRALLDRRHVVVEIGGDQHGQPEVAQFDLLRYRISRVIRMWFLRVQPHLFHLVFLVSTTGR